MWNFFQFCITIVMLFLDFLCVYFWACWEIVNIKRINENLIKTNIYMCTHTHRATCSVFIFFVYNDNNCVAYSIICTNRYTFKLWWWICNCKLGFIINLFIINKCCWLNFFFPILPTYIIIIIIVWFYSIIKFQIYRILNKLTVKNKNSKN